MKIEMLGLEIGCPACKTIKNKLEQKDMEYIFYDLMDKPDNERVIEMKKDMHLNHTRTIPAIWVDGEFHGAGLREITIV